MNIFTNKVYQNGKNIAMHFSAVYMHKNAVCMHKTAVDGDGFSIYNKDESKN